MVWIYYSSLNHLNIEGHFDHFHFMTITNKVAKINHVHVFV